MHKTDEEARVKGNVCKMVLRPGSVIGSDKKTGGRCGGGRAEYAKIFIGNDLDSIRIEFMSGTAQE